MQKIRLPFAEQPKPWKNTILVLRLYHKKEPRLCRAGVGEVMRKVRVLQKGVWPRWSRNVGRSVPALAVSQVRCYRGKSLATFLWNFPRQIGLKTLPYICAPRLRSRMEPLPRDDGGYRSRAATHRKHAAGVSRNGQGADSDSSSLCNREPKGVCTRQRHRAQWRESLQVKGFFASFGALFPGNAGRLRPGPSRRR